MFIICTVQECFYIIVITKCESKIQHHDLKLIYNYDALCCRPLNLCLNYQAMLNSRQTAAAA